MKRSDLLATERARKKRGQKGVMKKEDLINSLKLMVDGIAGTFGPRCEVVLHDLNNLDHSIIKIANGHITGRDVGGPITDRGLKDLKSGIKENLFINYPSKTKEGRLLKSSSMIFRDEKGIPFAAFCINFDITDILNFAHMIQEIFATSEEVNKENGGEIFARDINFTLGEISDKVIGEIGIPISSMGKSEKLNIVKRLEEQGFFLIKGGIKYIAKRLNVSKFTIYNYLDEVKAQKAEQKQ